MAEPTCAVWYWRYNSLMYRLCDTERDAAESANYIEDYGEGSVVGIQFADGRVLKVDEWPEYAAEARRIREREEAERTAAAGRPKPATRSIRDPFEGRTVEVEADEPGWLGRG